MPFIFLYLIKMSVWLAAVFLFYHFVLRKLTFYNWNRYYLLLYLLLSFCIPLMDVSGLLQYNNLQHAKLVKWVPAFNSQYTAIESASIYSAQNLLLLLLMLGMLTGVIRLCIQFVSFSRLKKKANVVYNSDIAIYQVDADIIPFSFGRSIFINQQLHSETELQEIIRHEFVHVKQQHSVDIMLCELLCVINWYNPFAWLLKNAVRQNLEFIADDKVLQNGIDKKSYQYMLLKVTGNNQFSVTSQFNFSSLKKRIAMMNKMKTARPHLMKFLFVVPLLAVMLLAFRNNWKEHPVATQSNGSINTHELQISKQAKSDSIPTIRDSIAIDLDVNKKGYFISIIGDKEKLVVVIQDKARKVVKWLFLSEWKKNERENIERYGDLPVPPAPPPPPPPAPPALPAPPPPTPGEPSNSRSRLAPVAPDAPLPPSPPLAPIAPDGTLPPTPPLPPIAPKLPANVSRINVNNNKATVVLKNGKKETYDLTVPAQKESFDKQYMPKDLRDSSVDQ